MKCNECRFYREGQDHASGHCHASAPRATVGFGDEGRPVDTFWPPVMADDGCGDHEPVSRALTDGSRVATLGPLFVTVERAEDDEATVYLDCWHKDLDEGLATIKLTRDEDGMHRLRIISSALQGDDQQDVWDEGLA